MSHYKITTIVYEYDPTGKVIKETRTETEYDTGPAYPTFPIYPNAPYTPTWQPPLVTSYGSVTTASTGWISYNGDNDVDGTDDTGADEGS